MYYRVINVLTRLYSDQNVLRWRCINYKSTQSGLFRLLSVNLIQYISVYVLRLFVCLQQVELQLTIKNK